MNNVADTIKELKFRDAEHKILPLIRKMDWFKNKPQFDKIEIGNDVAITFVMDINDDNYIFLPSTKLQEWKLSLYDADELARKNLSIMSQHVDYTLGETPDGSNVIVFDNMDGYDSSRLLLPDLWERMTTRFSQRELYAAIPIQNLLVVTNNKKSIEEKIKADYRKYLNSNITKEWFLLTQDGVSGTLENGNCF